MLKMDNPSDTIKMCQYYRASDMLNIIQFFPGVSPAKDLTIIESKEEYLNNKEFCDSFKQNRVDTLKGRMPILGIENTGQMNSFYCVLEKIKEKDPLGVLLLFNLDCEASNRYERYAGISVGVNLGENVIIEAVSKGFDGREVTKSICTHERYIIPWYNIRGLSVDNLKEYQVYKINNKGYQKTREERINFLVSIGYNLDEVNKSIPPKYEDIPDFIWLSVIRDIIKKLLKNEDDLKRAGLNNFAISGHTEGRRYAPWQMHDKTRYDIK